MPSAEPASPKPIRPSWTTLLGVLTAFVGLGTVTLHVMGMASHRAYMQFWGIDSGVLPKTTDQVLRAGSGRLNTHRPELSGLAAV